MLLVFERQAQWNGHLMPISASVLSIGQLAYHVITLRNKAPTYQISKMSGHVCICPPQALMLDYLKFPQTTWRNCIMLYRIYIFGQLTDTTNKLYINKL